MNKEEKNQIKYQFKNIVKKIARGEKDALERFYSIYGRLIYSVAFKFSKSRELADEIVDDVLVKVWQTASTLIKIKNPNGWIYLVTANCAKDKLKAGKHTCEIYEIPQSDINIDKIMDDDLFYFYISVLNEDEQEVLILRFIQDLPFKIIAKEINKPLSSVTSIYYRAKEKLKNNLKTN